MYKIIICIICFLPYVALSELPINAQYMSEKQDNNKTTNIKKIKKSDWGADDEELFPDIPLTLDSEILNSRNDITAADGKSQINVPPGDLDLNIDSNTPKKKSVAVVKKNKEKVDIPIKISDENKGDFSFWKVKDKSPRIEKEYVVPPKSISRKKYSAANHSLPSAVYISDYKKLVFQEIKSNDIDAVQALLRIIQDAEFRNANGETPLLYAVRVGKIKMVAFLLAIGADAKALDINGQNAYHIAYSKQRFNVLNVLNKAGA